ncbi:MAG: hypothetical protein RI917_479, partial [Actinomycetota bacterium]
MTATLLEPVDRPKNAQPWRKLGKRMRFAVLTASVVPALSFLGFLGLTGIDFMAGLILMFLPLQLVLGAWAGIYTAGRRGMTDGLLMVVTFFLSAFVLVLLASVVWGVIQTGSQALSPHFLYQNNVYVSGRTGLEIGGVGHAILGTIITVGTSVVVTVPLGLATAVYLTETRQRGRG